MKEPNLVAIKRENVGRIFEVLSRGGFFSRAELAKETGISLMTVGKTVDLLYNHGALIQLKGRSETVGRKSSICGLDEHCFMMVYDLSSNQYSIHVVDILLQTRAEYAFDFQNLKEKSAEAFMEIISSDGKIIGTGCIIPTAQSEDITDLKKNFIKALGGKPDLFEDAASAAAIANATRFEADKIVYISYSASAKDNFSVICDGKIGCSNFGRKGSFGELTKLIGDPIKAIAAISLTVNPAIIIIECCDAATSDSLRDGIAVGISRYIDGELPEIIIETTENAHDAVYGTALILCRHWLDNII